MPVSTVKELPHLDSFVDDHANDFREATFSSAFYLRVDYTVMLCFTNFDKCFRPFKDVVFFVIMRQRIYTNFLEDSLPVSVSSEIVWIEKLNYFHEGIYFPYNGCHGNRKKAISQL